MKCPNCCSCCQGFSNAEQENASLHEENKHMRTKLELADRMACFIKNRMGWMKGTHKTDANELLNSYFGRSNE
jgi:hypothetical protein